MKARSSPSLRSLAKLAGVHHTTVSRALRNDPRVPEETRRRLCALAKAEGYRPDALISRCMIALQRGRRRAAPEVLGLLTSTTRMNEGNEPFRAFCRTISQRADELGYLVDEIWTGAPGMTSARVAKVLRARGIEGLIIPPNYASGGGHLSIDLSDLAVVQHCHSIWRPQLHRVEPHNFQNMMAAMREVVRRKYRRIGMVLFLGLDRLTGHEWEGAYHYYHATCPHLIRLKQPMFVCQGFDDEGLLRWVKAQKPDVLIGAFSHHVAFFQKNGFRIPEDLGLVSTSVNPWDTPMAGIDIRAEEIDRAAVDMVVAQINRHEKGIPKVARQILIEGVWRDGPTVRAPSPA